MALYLRENLAAVLVSQFSNKVVECVIVKVRPIDTLFVLVYRPPDTHEEEWTSALSHISEAVTMAQAHRRFTNLVLLGDFNLPDISWQSPIPPAGVRREARAA